MTRKTQKWHFSDIGKFIFSEYFPSFLFILLFAGLAWFAIDRSIEFAVTWLRFPKPTSTIIDLIVGLSVLNLLMDFGLGLWKRYPIGGVRENSSASGSALLWFSSVIFDEATQKEIFEAIYSDWEEEYAESKIEESYWGTVWINANYFLNFVWQVWWNNSWYGTWRRIFNMALKVVR